MSNLRMLCQKYIKIDDDLVEIYKEVEANRGKPRETALLAKYIKKYMEREDFKSGMRRQLVNELCGGVCEDD